MLLVSQFGIILISIAIFLVIIMSLVVMLLYARAKLTPQGEVKLQVNDKELTVNPGDTLLTTLSNQSIFLPSACGGGGTCAMCKAQVIEGGGSILQTDHQARPISCRGGVRRHRILRPLRRPAAGSTGGRQPITRL